jgi:hypothetical protein
MVVLVRDKLPQMDRILVGTVVEANCAKENT